MTTMRRLLFVAAVCTGAVTIPAGAALAEQSPTTGQPGTSAGFNCGTATAPIEPGNASSAPGSPFNEPSPGSAGGNAGTRYAGNGPGSVDHAGSTAAVSQYDSACRRLSSH